MKDAEGKTSKEKSGPAGSSSKQDTSRTSLTASGERKGIEVLAAHDIKPEDAPPMANLQPSASSQPTSSEQPRGAENVQVEAGQSDAKWSQTVS